MTPPDAITPVEGYRVWGIGYGRLWSPAAPVMRPWPVPEPLHARCLAGPPGSLSPGGRDHPPHEAPDPRCRCGIYGMWEPWEVGAVPVHPPFEAVLGRVEGWGRVLLGRRGWRASVARPVELYARPSWSGSMRRHVEILARGWKIPIREWDGPPIPHAPERPRVGGSGRSIPTTR